MSAKSAKTVLQNSRPSAWTTQRRVVFALFTRELKSRFSHFRMGYFWALAEPVALVGLMSMARLAFGRGDISGISYPLFFASGIIPYLYFVGGVNSSLNAVESSNALLNYRHVKPADPVIARLLLNFLISTFAGIILIGGMAYLGLTFRWNSTLSLLATVACLLGLTLGLSLISSIVGAVFRESQKIIPIVIRPLFFVSGIFFSAESLPPDIREWLLINPLFHVSELVRASIFLDYQSQHGSLSYLSICTLVTLTIGLSVYRSNRILVATSGTIK